MWIQACAWNRQFRDAGAESLAARYGAGRARDVEARQNLVDHDRLDEIVLKAGCQCRLPMFVVAMPGDGDQLDGAVFGDSRGTCAIS